MTKRNLIAYTRVPDAIFFSSVQPIMFVLLFRYVFGGAIPTPGTTTCSSSCRASSSRQSPRIDRHLYRSCRRLAEGPHRAVSERSPCHAGQCSPAGRHSRPVPQPVRDGPDDRCRVRRGLPHREQCRRVPRRDFCSSCCSPTRSAGIRLRRPLRTQQRDGTADVVPRAVPGSPSRPRPSFRCRRCRAGCRASPSISRCPSSSTRGPRSHVGVAKPDLVFPPFTSVASTGRMSSTVFWAVVWSLGILAGACSCVRPPLPAPGALTIRNDQSRSVRPPVSRWSAFA